MEIHTQLQHVSEKNVEKLERAKNDLPENLKMGKNTSQQDTGECCTFHLSKRHGEITCLQVLSSSMRKEDGAEIVLQKEQGHSNEQMAGDRNRQCEIEAHLFNTGCD